MSYDDRIRVLPCGCRYDVASGVATNLCEFHAGLSRPDVDALLEDDEDDGLPYTDAVDDEDGMSEIERERYDLPEED